MVEAQKGKHLHAEEAEYRGQPCSGTTHSHNSFLPLRAATIFSNSGAPGTYLPPMRLHLFKVPSRQHCHTGDQVVASGERCQAVFKPQQPVMLQMLKMCMLAGATVIQMVLSDTVGAVSVLTQVHSRLAQGQHERPGFPSQYTFSTPPGGFLALHFSSFPHLL